jgi:hypothetical protein
MRLTVARPFVLVQKNADEIAGNHVYVPIGVDSSNKTITLYDPGAGIVVYPVSALKRSCDFLWISKS